VVVVAQILAQPEETVVVEPVQLRARRQLLVMPILAVAGGVLITPKPLEPVVVV
jgi:hypothetical protein